VSPEELRFPAPKRTGEPAGWSETTSRSDGLPWRKPKRPAIFDNLVTQVSCINDLVPLAPVWTCTRESDCGRRGWSGQQVQRHKTRALENEKGNIVLLARPNGRVKLC